MTYNVTFSSWDDPTLYDTFRRAISWTKRKHNYNSLSEIDLRELFEREFNLKLVYHKDASAHRYTVTFVNEQAYTFFMLRFV
jgi:hypothetical protein